MEKDLQYLGLDGDPTWFLACQSANSMWAAEILALNPVVESTPNSTGSGTSFRPTVLEIPGFRFRDF